MLQVRLVLSFSFLPAFFGKDGQSVNPNGRRKTKAYTCLEKLGFQQLRQSNDQAHVGVQRSPSAHFGLFGGLQVAGRPTYVCWGVLAVGKGGGVEVVCGTFQVYRQINKLSLSLSLFFSLSYYTYYVCLRIFC